MACTLTQMELETDFLSCQDPQSPPKSDIKDNKKLAQKNILDQVVFQFYKMLKQGEGTHAIPIDELNCFTFSFDSILPDFCIPPINEHDVP